MMIAPDPHTASTLNLVTWLNSLPCVTDFEYFALSELKKACDQYSIETSYIGDQQQNKQLLIGNKNANVIFITHIDRIGFVATKGKISVNSVLEVSYIQPPRSDKTREKIEGRFKNSDTELVGYDPSNGKFLFYAKLIDRQGIQFLAKITKIIIGEGQEIDEHSPIPLTGAKIPEQIEGERFKGTFDNSVGIAIALQTIAQYPTQLACIVTTREEGGGYASKDNKADGRRGAYEYGSIHDPTKLLVVIDDRPSESEEIDDRSSDDEKRTFVGKGVVLRKREGDLDAYQVAFDYIVEFCKTQQIQYQMYNGEGGKTEAGRVSEALQKQGKKLKCIWLQPPVADNHCPFEEISEKDIDDTRRLAEALADPEFQNLINSCK